MNATTVVQTPANEFTPREKCHQLRQLAAACNEGACNLRGLIRSLDEALAELRWHEQREHPAVGVIMGHLAFLCGQSAGPQPDTYTRWRLWQSGERIEWK